MVEILGLMGSPRTGGNTDLLLGSLLSAAGDAGAEVDRVVLSKKKISPCLECGGCDETGRCVVDDDMIEIYKKIASADVVVVASPIFFYNITSWTQALVERSQACWVRKYVLKKGPIGGKKRKGIFISLGATKGERLFDGALMVMRYFFDAIGAEFSGALLYRGIEARGAVRDHPDALRETEILGGMLARGEDVSGLDFLYHP